MITGLSAKQMMYEARILFESIASGDAPGFTPREWSVLLTNAQDKVVYEVYKKGADKDEDSRIAIQALIKYYEVENLKKGKNLENSYIASLPNDFRYVIVDWCDAHLDDRSKVKGIRLVPISYDAYFVNLDNPFKRPSKDKFWKLVHNDEADEAARIIVTPEGWTVDAYKTRYIKRPYPIIVDLLPPGKGIEYLNNTEIREQTDCQLHSNTHRRIVEHAARLAYAATLDVQGYQIQSAENAKI